MLPRRPNIAVANPSSKPKSLQPVSLLSFGIRTGTKQQLNIKPLNKDAKTSSKIIQHSAYNPDKNHNNLQHLRFGNGFVDYPNNLSRQMQNQNQECKPHIQREMFLGSQNNHKRKIFSDQINQKPNLLKLNNMTNLDFQEIQSCKENSYKNQSNLYLSTQFFEDNLFENDQENKTQKIYVDMKKKIKKISKSKRLLHKSQRIQEHILDSLQNQQQKKRRELTQHHRNLMNNAFLDSEVIIDSSIFCSKIINHRIDNDVDTDDEQITSGINRLKKSLQDAVKQNKSWIIEKKNFMEDIENQDDNSIQLQLCRPNLEYF